MTDTPLSWQRYQQCCRLQQAATLLPSYLYLCTKEYRLKTKGVANEGQTLMLIDVQIYG